MIRTTPRRQRPIPVADRIREYEPNLRDTAVGWLTEKISVGDAGLDPFTASVFILLAHPDELVWAYRMLEQVGTVLVIGERPDGSRRYAASVETDVRAMLGLDRADAPTLDVPEEAAQADHASTVLMDAVFGALPEPRTMLQLIEPDERSAS